jgi:universal stress protein E
VHPFDPILAVVDPTSTEQPAAHKAARLAAATGSCLHLLVCDYEAAFDDDPLYRSEALRRLRTDFLSTREKLLAELAPRLRAHGCEVATSVHWSARLHEGILDVAARLHPGLIIKDTHYHSALRRSLFTNTDWRLVHECQQPLLLAKPGDWHEEPRMMAALDPDQTRDADATLVARILAVAERMRTSLRADLHLVHACNDSALLAAATSGARPLQGGIDAAELIRIEHRRLEHGLAALADAHGVHATRIAVQGGNPPAVILELAADWSADIVVMGALSHSELRKRLLGSTAERTLDRLPCDLLVVKAPA